MTHFGVILGVLSGLSLVVLTRWSEPDACMTLGGGGFAPLIRVEPPLGQDGSGRGSPRGLVGPLGPSWPPFFRGRFSMVFLD